MRQVAITVPLSSRNPFTHIQVLRGAALERVTDVIATAAMTGPRVPALFGTETYKPLALSGKTLVLEVGGAERSVVFSGTDPLSIDSIRSQIETAVPEIETFLSQGQVRLATRSIGVSAKLKVIDSDAARTMGLPTDLRVGLQENLLLQENVVHYRLLDILGEPDTEYRWRLVDAAGNVGPLSYVTYGRPPLRQTVRAYLELISADGAPVANREAVLLSEGPAFSGATLVFHDILRTTTDEDGQASFNVLSGGRYTLSIPGTSISHRFQAPSDVEEFSLLDPAYALENDAFTVRKPAYTPAIQRTLP